MTSRRIACGYVVLAGARGMERGRPNALLRVLDDRALAAPVPLPVLLADLADHGGPRESAVVERLLRELPR